MLSSDEGIHLDLLTRIMSRLVDSLGKVTVEEVATLLRFVGFENEGQGEDKAVCYFALLVGARHFV